MAHRLRDECRSVDGGREFRWAFGAATFHRARFVSFALLKMLLLVSGIVADSEVGRVLALVAFVVAFVAEELSADRLVVAATDTEIVVFDAARGVPHVRPTSVWQRVSRGDVRRTSLGLFGEGWDLGGRSIQVATWHRSLIRGWVGEQPADDTLSHSTRST